MSFGRARMAAIALVGLVVGLGLGRVVLQKRGSPGAYAARTEQIMATPIMVEAPPDQIDQAVEIVFGVFHEVDDRMSEWKETSPLSAVNRSAGVRPVEVPPDLRAVLRRGIDLGRLTDGAFDITWAALWGLWDFKAEHPAPPSQDQIDSRLPLIDFRRVHVDDGAGTVSLERPGMMLGLGGIAKGYALDRAGEALRASGIRSFLLSAGGQVLVGGPRPGSGGPWRIGIRDPRGDVDDFFATIRLADASVATSGDYERYFLYEGVRYHHILDPRTGRPSRGVRSVSVISPDATLADGLSTALMILGVEHGLAVVESLPGIEAVFVDDQGAVHVSAGLGSNLEILHAPRAQ